MTTDVLFMYAKKQEAALRNLNSIKNFCAIMLLVLAVMNITGMMRHYKAIVLGVVL